MSPSTMSQVSILHSVFIGRYLCVCVVCIVDVLYGIRHAQLSMRVCMHAYRMFVCVCACMRLRRSVFYRLC